MLGVTLCVCIQVNSSDVAESLGLSVGRYEYVERRPEISTNVKTAEALPSTDSSVSMPSENVAHGNGHQDVGTVKDALENVVITADSNTETLQSTDANIYLESGVAAADGEVARDNNESTVLLQNTDIPAVTGESNMIEHPQIDSCVGNNTSENNMCGDVGSRAASLMAFDSLVPDSTCADTDGIPLTSGNACQPDDASFVSETTASDQKNTLSETDTLLPTAEDLEGLLKVFSRTS